jgi:hypothetical protein
LATASNTSVCVIGADAALLDELTPSIPPTTSTLAISLAVRAITTLLVPGRL